MAKFNQLDDLIKRELVPPDWESPYTDGKRANQVKFPVKCTKAIYRIRLKDETEWIKTKQDVVGTGRSGQSCESDYEVDKEMYDAILPLYKLKPDN